MTPDQRIKLPLNGDITLLGSLKFLDERPLAGPSDFCLKQALLFHSEEVALVGNQCDVGEEEAEYTLPKRRMAQCRAKSLRCLFGIRNTYRELTCQLQATTPLMARMCRPLC